MAPIRAAFPLLQVVLSLQTSTAERMETLFVALRINLASYLSVEIKNYSPDTAKEIFLFD